MNLKDKFVKVYKDVSTKHLYEGDARIIEVIKQVHGNIYQVNLAFDDNYETALIDSDDILY